MGYRSDVRFKIREEDFIKLKEKYLESGIPDNLGYNLFEHLSSYIPVEEYDIKCIQFGWNNMKWYNDYEDVSFITDYVCSLDDYAFLRIGESCEGDIEEDSSGLDPIDYYYAFSLEDSNKMCHNISELHLMDYDSHEAVGFKLAMAFLTNPNQHFNNLREKYYEEENKK